MMNFSKIYNFIKINYPRLLLVGLYNYWKLNKKALKGYGFKDNRVVLFYLGPSETISGGTLSIFFLLQQTKILFPDATVLPITTGILPTYVKNTWFNSPHTIINLRFIDRKLLDSKEIIVHIPEVFFPRFSRDIKKYRFRSPQKSIANILNQNQEVMPSHSFFAEHKSIFKKMTMTLAFEANTDIQFPYLDQSPVLLNSWFYNDNIENIPFEEKEDIAIISPDENIYKDKIVEILVSKGIKCYHIKNMPFSQFKDLQKRAKWSFSFGEGYDGYSAFAFYKSGIGFGVYNKNYFPPNIDLSNAQSFYKSYEYLVSNISKDIDFFNNKRNFENYVLKILPLVRYNNSPEKVITNLKKYYKITFDD